MGTSKTTGHVVRLGLASGCAAALVLSGSAVALAQTGSAGPGGSLDAGSLDGGSLGAGSLDGGSLGFDLGDVTPLESRDDLENEAYVHWIRAGRVGPSTLRVTFPIGDQNCWGYRAEVEETPRTIRIAIYQGTIPGAPEVCTMIGGTGAIDVTLDAPIGARQISRLLGRPHP